MKHIYLIGSKGIPAHYGGFETFVDRLTAGKRTEELTYHVACLDHEDRTETLNGAECFHLKVPEVGPAKAVLYDRKAFLYALSDIKANGYTDAIILVLACRLGPFFPALVKKAHRLHAKVFVNPDGHEWMRAKWSAPIQKYWKYSERKMVKEADLLVCDAREMERYIKTEYADLSPKTTYLSYGADLVTEPEEAARFAYEDWLKEHELTESGYALIVGRFVPENNYETMLREYLASKSKLPLVLICNAERNKFYEGLSAALPFESDPRIRFVGTVYDKPLLSMIRRGAVCYLHGHEVGGTNPTLLEALASTEVNLLLDIPFNREVAEDAALYWAKETGSLCALIDHAVKLGAPQRRAWGAKAKNRIRDAYTWDAIIDRYEALFLSDGTVQ